ncbi:MAG TPA: MFS transporter [Candidatus Limiplasma sp.]|mgnify:CR=1 FL=1|nr:MFS transporter [Candidatus Limiplasma sp.]
MKQLKIRREMVLFFIIVAAAAFGAGLSDSVYANYYKDAFNVTATQRAFIEFPRELPGLLCLFVITALSAYGMAKSNLVGQICSFVGLLALGLLTPSFGVMLIFLFINSMGTHLFLPLNDAIGMGIAEPDQVGHRIGQYASVKTAMGFAAGILVFFGFRLGWFSFTADINVLFLIGAGSFLVAVIASALLVKERVPLLSVAQKKRTKIVLRKEYKYYYFVTMLNGVQKQIALVFGSWVIIDLLGKKADTMSLLMITVSFISIFFMRMLGRWIDRLGVKKMMYLDALTFIFVYTIYGLVVWGITGELFSGASWPVFAIYALFIMDRLSMQIGVVKSVYLRSIARSPEEIPSTLSTGTTLDHVVAILAAQISGVVWTLWGPQWVFFIAAFFSLGNLFVAWRIPQSQPKAAVTDALEEDMLSDESI